MFIWKRGKMLNIVLEILESARESPFYFNNKENC